METPLNTEQTELLHRIMGNIAGTHHRPEAVTDVRLVEIAQKMYTGNETQKEIELYLLAVEVIKHRVAAVAAARMASL